MPPMPTYQRPRGTRDLLPEEAAAMDALQAVVEAAMADGPRSGLTGRALRRFDVETDGEPDVLAAAGATSESPVAA